MNGRIIAKNYKSVSDSGRSKSLPFFQPRLTINQPGDVYEQEADAMADKVMRAGSKNGMKESFFSPGISAIQRKCDQCEEEEKKLQRKESGPETISTSLTENYIGSLSAGMPLNVKDRSFFEAGFGYDFGEVRVHTNDMANESAKNLNAVAYTNKNNIVFGAGQYQPGTDKGKKLLAHELTHVVQQNNNKEIKSLQRQPDNKCRKDTPDLENPEDLTLLYKSELSKIPASDKKVKGTIKAAVPGGGSFYLYNILNNAGCDSIRPLIDGSDFYLIQKGQYYDQVWAMQKDAPPDKYYWGWVDKRLLEYKKEEKKEGDDSTDEKKKNDNSGKTETDKKDKAKDEGSGDKPDEKITIPDVNECDNENFCTPFTDMTIAERVKFGANYRLKEYIYPILVQEGVDLWKAYMKRKPGDDMTPVEFKSPGSDLAEKFGSAGETENLQEEIIKNILKKSADQAIDVYPDKPIFYRVELLADWQTLNTPIEFDSTFSPDTSLTAGGAGKGDSRNVTGMIAIEPTVKNDITEEQNYRLTTQLQLNVTDTIDFCPGKCGAPLEKYFLTLSLSRLEATGLVYDVPFEVHSEIPEVAYDYVENDLHTRVIQP